jgi:hypothetical protein
LALVGQLCDNGQDNEASTFNILGPPILVGAGDKTMLEQPLIHRRVAPTYVFRLQSAV